MKYSIFIIVIWLLLQVSYGWCESEMDLEPSLQGRNDIIFFEDFESSDWYTHWDNVDYQDRVHTVTYNSFKGNKCLRVFIPRGGHYGTGMGFYFRRHGLEEPEEIYFRYYIYAGPTFGGGGKLPGIAGTYGRAGWGGRRVNGSDGWSARMAFAESGKEGEIAIGYYVYHADMMTDYGDTWIWGTIKKGEWHCIECYVKMNDPKKKNGILRGWIDGKLVFEKTDIRFRDIPDLKIECIWFNVYYGGTEPAPRDMEVYFDNIIIARNYIGPWGSEKPIPSFMNQVNPENVTEDTTILEWSKSPDPNFEKYEVLMAPSPNGPWKSIANVTITTYKVTGLSPNTTYYFKVRVWDKFGRYTDEETNVIQVITKPPFYLRPWFMITVALFITLLVALLLFRRKYF